MTFKALLATEPQETTSARRVDSDESASAAPAPVANERCAGAGGPAAMPDLAGPVFRGRVRSRTVVDVDA